MQWRRPPAAARGVGGVNKVVALGYGVLNAAAGWGAAVEGGTRLTGTTGSRQASPASQTSARVRNVTAATQPCRTETVR